MNDNPESSNGDGSVTGWIHAIKGGDPSAPEAIWNRYFSQVVSLARRKMSACPTGLRDEEDIALSVFAKFFDAAQKGNLSALKDRDGLWRLLFAITQRKLVDNYRYETRLKRNDPNSKTFNLEVELADFPNCEPTPGFAAIMAEELHTLLLGLKSERHKEAVMSKLGGATNEEIADDLECSVRTVERILREVRQSPFWSEI